MKLSYAGIQDKVAWEGAGIALPKFDWQQMVDTTNRTPVWVHFGAGNIFRGFIAALQQTLLDENLAHSGIVAVDTFDFDIIDKIYTPFDSMTMLVGLQPDGGMKKEVVASISKGLRGSSAYPEDMEELKSIFRNQSLQMVSFTITEKGYALTNLQGNFFPFVVTDLENGPSKATHVMSIVTALLQERFNANAGPIAMVSMDNCSHNGEILKTGVTTIAKKWLEKGFVSQAFVDWLEDETQVSFPWSMIDKITPRPAPVVEKALKEMGVEDMAPIITSKNTFIAPFVNAEIPEYLVVEDRFPNGRPHLEKAGVFLTTRDTVNDTETMKVTTCLNPLHTALAVFGCLLGYELIAEEMKDDDLRTLVERIGYDEAMPVVTNPGIIDPMEFIKVVLTQRLPNPFMPDAPQRIATDTSQKLAIRFGETIKSYAKSVDLDVKSLTLIPLVQAAWLRYLLALDDEGKLMECSSDPMLDELQGKLANVKLGNPNSVGDTLKDILSNDKLFGVDLYSVGLADKVESMFKEMLAGPGAVRATLKKYLGQ